MSRLTVSVQFLAYLDYFYWRWCQMWHLGLDVLFTQTGFQSVFCVPTQQTMSNPEWLKWCDSRRKLKSFEPKTGAIGAKWCTTALLLLHVIAMPLAWIHGYWHLSHYHSNLDTQIGLHFLQKTVRTEDLIWERNPFCLQSEHRQIIKIHIEQPNQTDSCCQKLMNHNKWITNNGNN